MSLLDCSRLTGATEVWADQTGKEAPVKTGELVKGEAYLVKSGYSEYRAVVVEAALYTDREVTEYETVTEMVDPPTPFDPNTGEKNPQIEKTRQVKKYRTVREPGYKPRSGYGYRSGATAGIPVKAVSAWSVGRESAAEPKDMLVRPQDFQCLWSTHVKAQQTDAQREAEQKAKAEDAKQRIASLPEELRAEAIYVSGNAGRGNWYGYTRTDKVTVSLEALEALVANQRTPVKYVSP
jgi:hypothetical protein